MDKNDINKVYIIEEGYTHENGTTEDSNITLDIKRIMVLISLSHRARSTW